MPETHTIIRGRTAIIIFSDDGEIKDVFIMDRENGYLSYRINSDVYHMTITLTEFAIEYEAKPGPFDSKNNIFPNWAPDGSDHKLAMNYINEVKSRIQSLL